jgi:hypothetical protein
MARKATDLLDVFRLAGEPGEEAPEGEARGTRRAAAHKRKAPRPARRRVRGMILNQRQLLLGGSAIALLLVLSFVIGLSAGRGGRSSGSGEALSATTAPRWFAIRGTLPQLDPATQKPVDPSQVMAILQRDYGLQPAQVVMRPSGDQLVLEVGPFPSEEKARAYHRDAGLEMIQLHMHDPFRWPEYVAWSGR